MDKFKAMIKNLIIKKIAEEAEEKYSIYPLKFIVQFVVKRWEEEKAKNEGLK